MLVAYLAFHIFAHSSLYPLIHLLQVFATNDFPMDGGSLIPKPPIDLGLQTFSQATRAHFFSFKGPLHKKVVYKFRILLIIFVGAARTEKR